MSTSKQSSSKKRSIGYVVPHTHWDREWRYPLWKNRILLVEVMDEMLACLEKDPEYKCFVTDGQVVMIEDYLAVRPENTARLSKHVKDNRLMIGPWYTLPDLYPIDGECLVRNLLKGIRLSDTFGGHLKVGYNTFGWGQTAQFPQIYAGFGINYLIAAKKVSHERAPDCEFWWEAPDGTRVLTTRLGSMARANLYFNAMLPVRFGMDYFSHDYRFEWEKPGVVIHNASPAKCHEDYFRLWDQPRYYPHLIQPTWQKAWDTLGETLAPNCRLIMDGSDFTNFQPELPGVIRDANKVFDDIEFVNARFEDYFEHFMKTVDKKKIKTVRGELRDGQACEVSANALASRMYIKIINKRAENTLIRTAEPLASALAMLGAEYPMPLLTTAWQYLLQSHPHDSINGVTQDKTADDTVNRLMQAIEIGEVVHEKSIGELVNRIDFASFDKKDVLLLFVNTTARPVHEVMKVAVDTPREYKVWDFQLRDAKGAVCQAQSLSRQEKTCPVNDMTARPWPFYFDRHMAYVDPGEIPAGGYKVLKVEPLRTCDHLGEWWPPMRKSTGREIIQAPGVMETELLKVTVNANGTVSLVDKATGKQFDDMHYFEDNGDNGDYWAFYEPYQNRIYTSLGCPARVFTVENGDLAATIGVEITMTLPAYARRSEAGVVGDNGRSVETRTLTITSHFTLRRGSTRLDVHTSIDNTVEDHRMRLMLPTGIAAKASHAAGHFTVDERPVQPVRESDGKFWPDMQTVPMQRFVDVSDGKHGIAVVNNCFTEYEALRDSRHTLAITLLRSMKNRICTEWRSSGHFPMQKGSQSLRTMEYSYAICPHAGDWVHGNIAAQADNLNVPPAVYQTAAHRRGRLPTTLSFYGIDDPNLILSAFKKAEDRDSFILRLYNPTPRAIRSEVRFYARIKKAWLTTLNEEREKPIAVTNGKTVNLTVPKGKIITLELEI
jgi:mannosylglycerate hydrolase